MSSLTNPRVDVDIMIGVDTHEQFHVAAAVDAVTGGVIDTITVEASPAGYRMLSGWADAMPGLHGWAVEGTNSHGIGLTRHLAGELVLEADRPNRTKRRHGVKNDHVDAVRAAREALGRTTDAVPRDPSGPRAVLQVLVTARNLTVTQARDTGLQLRALILTAPDGLRGRYTTGPTRSLITQTLHLRPRADDDPLTLATIPILKTLALRARDLHREAAAMEREILALVKQMRPDLLALHGVGPIVAANLLIAWSHPGRIRSEAAFAMLAGTAPIPATSGIQQTRHRLNRSGDRQLNYSIHTIVLSRQRHDAATIAYVQRRTAEGKTPREIRRCLKRYVTRQTYRILENPVDKT